MTRDKSPQGIEVLTNLDIDWVLRIENTEKATQPRIYFTSVYMDDVMNEKKVD